MTIKEALWDVARAPVEALSEMMEEETGSPNEDGLMVRSFTIEPQVELMKARVSVEVVEIKKPVTDAITYEGAA